MTGRMARQGQRCVNMTLSKKHAVVSGGSRGIGRAIALELARQGANVAILYAGNAEAANETCESAKALGVEALALRCDVSQYSAVEEAIQQVKLDFGKIDILVNNAGINRDALLLTMKPEDFDAVLDTNLKGAFYLIKQVYPIMMRARWGRIINISSVAGITGNAGQANYASAKAGLIGLTKTVAKELAGRGVTCNAIAPGFIATDMTDKLPEKIKEAALSTIPMKRMGAPEDIAALTAFLAGDGAGYLTGQVIQVDGGLAM